MPRFTQFTDDRRVRSTCSTGALGAPLWHWEPPCSTGSPPVECQCCALQKPESSQKLVYKRKSTYTPPYHSHFILFGNAALHTVYGRPLRVRPTMSCSTGSLPEAVAVAVAVDRIRSQSSVSSEHNVMGENNSMLTKSWAGGTGFNGSRLLVWLWV